MVLNSWSNWNLIFADRGKPENPEKNPLRKGVNQQTTLLTYHAETEN
jgi:hypothetical protein